MALETLKGIKKIGKFDVHQDNEITDGKWSDVDKRYSVCIHHGDNTISFRIQNGPIKEKGENGCQVDTLIETAKIIIQGLNKKYPCYENSMVIGRLIEALSWLETRTEDRIKRGVEGTSEK